jgi:hypothetical protein
MMRFLTVAIAGCVAACSAQVDQKSSASNVVEQTTQLAADNIREDSNSDSLSQIMNRRAERYRAGGRFILVSNQDNGSEVKPVPPGRPDCGESSPRRVFKAAYAQCGLNSEMLPNRGEFSCWMVPKVDHSGCVEQCIFVDCAPP